MSWSKEIYVAILALLGICVHLVLRFVAHTAPPHFNLPLLIVLIAGGGVLIKELLASVWRRQFGADLLAGISIITALFLGEYLAGAIVVLMLSGGEALEQYAVGRASSVLSALAKRMPQVAHLVRGDTFRDIEVSEICVGDKLTIFPHEICPVDGVVVTGHGVMDESFLTGEPFQMHKSAGSSVISGAVNGEYALTIEATKLPVDSRYAKIMQVMERSAQYRPSIRRIGDELGAWYTPLAVAIGVIAWLFSGEAARFLAVMVIATPCPLLIAIPVAIIGTISLAARRGIIIRDPAQLEQIDQCRTIIFDKTGTLTYGKPSVTEIHCAAGRTAQEVLKFVSSLERYSKHPLASAVLERAAALKMELLPVSEVHEAPGQGLRGVVGGAQIWITSRKKLMLAAHRCVDALPSSSAGLECVALINDQYLATLKFHDAPRQGSRPFIEHLTAIHPFKSVILLSGDRASEVRYFAQSVGMQTVYAEKSPEEKLEIVRKEVAHDKTVYVGDGINDAPAMNIATVGVALGQHNEIITEAAGAVIMDASLQRLDEFFHIARRMRQIALQSAWGGMALSIGGMLVAAFGVLTPVAGALGQELIDLAAVLNALRASLTPETLSDFDNQA